MGRAGRVRAVGPCAVWALGVQVRVGGERGGGNAGDKSEDEEGDGANDEPAAGGRRLLGKGEGEGAHEGEGEGPG